MNLQAYLHERGALVEQALNRYLPPITETPERLHEAIRYSVLAPGKRLRPILVLASAEAVGGKVETVMPTACALECIHAFSLIHDDLPCMDDDDYRRGRLTNHKVYGEAMAMLAGDALLALAFELISSNSSSVAPTLVVEAVRMVSNASGTWGMVGGQVVDIESEDRDISPETLGYIHAHKTGALLKVSTLVGAVMCGATADQRNALTKYGDSIGLAFQIADDILDIVGDEKKLGKPVGSDEKQKKATYPKVFGMNESRLRMQTETAAAIEALSSFGDTAEPLRAIARFIVERDL